MCLNCLVGKVAQFIIIIIITIIMRTETYCHFRDRDRMVVGFTTTYASTYHHCEFESRSWWGVFNTTLCDKVSQWLAADLWFSPGIQVCSTNKTNRHHITEILLKVKLNTITHLNSSFSDVLVPLLICFDLNDGQYLPVIAGDTCTLIGCLMS
jgi:hypothetical protein